MNIKRDKRIVLTLDAGGTNFVFSAIKGGEEMFYPITKASNAHDLEMCLETIINGFEEVKSKVDAPPDAISFAFPGPADYPNGIIGDLPNLPCFKGGIPLGPILQEHFNIPVFINNDGDLFAYGEALAGVLPEINKKLEEAGSTKRYHNLIGFTVGTGFGAGIVRNGELFLGDNSTAAEVWIFSNSKNPKVNAEEGVSIRAIQKAYRDYSNNANQKDLSPKDIYEIAVGKMDGDATAARKAYEKMGANLGDILANLLSLIDGIAVIGGGLTGARALYMPALMKELKSSFVFDNGDELKRLVQKIYNLDNKNDENWFCKNYSKKIYIPGTKKSLNYDPVPRLAIITSKLGASKAISLGAYCYALRQLDAMEGDKQFLSYEFSLQ